MMSLTPNEQNFILLLRAALSDSTEQKKALAPPIDVEGILRLAYEQKLWHMILAALPHQLLPKGLPCRHELIGHVAAQVSLCSDFLAFLEELELAGFHPLVVKGIVCRTLYPHPELRPSSDEDLYISEEEFEPCCAYLSEHGWTPDKTPFSLYDEIGWRSESGGSMELHRALFDKDFPFPFDLLAFKKIKAVRYDTPYGKTVCSMSPHDHLLYLILHAFKHFVHSGFGIRQVCDVGLWASRYEKQVDWDALSRTCEELHVKGFALSLFGIARYHLSIPLSLPDGWDCNKDYCLPMLKDLLCGGIYGSASIDRLHSVNLTLGAVKNHGERPSLGRALFPPKSALEKSYPFIKKHPLLMPVAYFKRLFSYAKKASLGKVKASASIAIGKERVALLRFYGILD
jgi:hypothetical protein